MITALDAMIVVAIKLPDEGVTLREFVTRACTFRGDPDDVIEQTILLAEQAGFRADDIVTIGPAGTKLH